jgi:hypothetical protein
MPEKQDPRLGLGRVRQGSRHCPDPNPLGVTSALWGTLPRLGAAFLSPPDILVALIASPSAVDACYPLIIVLLRCPVLALERPVRLIPTRRFGDSRGIPESTVA